MRVSRCLLLAIACGAAPCDAEPIERAAPPVEGTRLQRFEYRQPHMGVAFVIRLYAADEAAAKRAADAAYARVAELNDILSDYDPESELMRLCRDSAPGKPIEVSAELAFVLSRSLAMSRRTDGAFDVTIGPVVRLWRHARRRREMPNAELLAEARALVGWKSVRLDERARTVELLKPEMRLDLGGIAKGYAADEALRLLREHGIDRALIDAGGDIVMGDAPPGRAGWRIGIAPLDQPEGAPSRHLVLANQSVATSGDAFQHVEIAGTRYSHIVDPKTGLGLTTHSSVTVVASTGIEADALASAVSVLGPKKGIALVEETPKAAALVVQVEEGTPQTFESRRLMRFEERKSEASSR
ncbi:MAG: FAD:protein FMN transferase [Planctomycetaceae bacterium]